MRVLQLHARYRIAAGEDSVVGNEAAALARAGHDVEQYLVANPTSIRGSLATLARSLHNHGRAIAVRELIERQRPDVVHVHNTWFALSSSVVEAASASDVPVVMTLHNYRLGCLSADLFRDDAICTACVGRAPLPGIRHGCYRGSRALSAIQATEVMVTRRRGVLPRSVDLFVAPSAFMADRLVDIGVPADRLVVKPHFAADPGPRSQPPSKSNELVAIGRLAPGKGLDTLIDAWTSVADPQLRLTVIGDGPLAEQLAARPRDPRVRLEGWLSHDDVAARMRAARALVLPSEWYEPFGMVLIEAMGCGLPIVVTSIAGAPAIVGASPAFVAPPGDARALAALIDSLDDEVCDREGAANRSRFEADYTEPKGVEALESLYTRVVEAHRP